MYVPAMVNTILGVAGCTPVAVTPTRKHHTADAPTPSGALDHPPLGNCTDELIDCALRGGVPVGVVWPAPTGHNDSLVTGKMLSVSPV